MLRVISKWIYGLFVPGESYVQRSKSEKLKSQNSRMALVFFLALVLFVIPIVCHMIGLQTGISAMTDDIPGLTDYSRRFTAFRGGIYDRNGQRHPLAVSMPTWRVFVDSVMIPAGRHDEVGKILSGFGIFSEEKIDKAVKPGGRNRYCVIGETTDRAVYEAITTNRILKGCTGVEVFNRRYYPYGELMAHVVGLANASSNALDGVEYKFNQYLTPEDGEILGVADARRREVRSLRKKKTEPRNGADICLTLDTTIQFIVEKHLDEAMEKYSPRKAWAIVQRPYTGEILAMASRPVFSRRAYGDSSDDAVRNSAIKVNYDPGSIMKVATFAAGINDGIITSQSIIDCSERLYAGRPLSDHVHGPVDATTALAKSSNRAASIIAEQLGKERMDFYLRSFGFGSRTGIDLPGEESGILVGPKRLSDLQAIRMAIGHGISVTGIQMASLYSTIANKGIRMKPYIVKSITDSMTGESLVPAIRPVVVCNPITQATADTIRSMMTNVTVRGVGTGWRGAVSGYNVAGKTGTSQMPVPGGYSSTDYWASFAGFLPAESPEIVILVTLEAPKPLHQGGTVAAPVFSKIAYDTARYLNIPTKEEMKISGETYSDVRKRILGKP